jgi:hypothetical protein
MRAFGPTPWGPFEKDSWAPGAPEGPCAWCGEPVVPGEFGVVMPYLGGDVQEVAIHRECHLRQVLGSVGHQKGKCACFGGGEDDPPGMTRRDAARAAVREAGIDRD